MRTSRRDAPDSQMTGPRRSPRELAMLQAVLMAAGALAIGLTSVAGWLGGAPGIGPMEASGFVVGVAFVAAGAGLRWAVVGRVAAPYAGGLLKSAVLMVTLAAGGAGLEWYARSAAGYLPLAMPLVKRLYNERDRTKIYNARFVAQRAYQFGTFPRPPETFPADTPAPRYVFRPDLRLVLKGTRLVEASPHEPAFWSSNALGLRGAQIALEKPSGVRRIVALGASTTEGVYNADVETYPYFLQVALDRSGEFGRTEVVNAGFSGFALDDLTAIFMTKIARLHPDLVLFYEGHNDVDVREFVPDLNCAIGVLVGDCWMAAYPGWLAWMAHRSVVVLSALKTVHRSSPGQPLVHRFDAVSSKRSLNAIDAKLRRLVRAIRSQGVPVVLSSFASVGRDGLLVDRRVTPGLFDDLTFDRFPLTPGETAQIYEAVNRVSAKIAADCSVPYVDIAAAVPHEPAYFPYDVVHLSADGNRLIADQFARALHEPGVWALPGDPGCAEP